MRLEGPAFVCSRLFSADFVRGLILVVAVGSFRSTDSVRSLTLIGSVRWMHSMADRTVRSDSVSLCHGHVRILFPASVVTSLAASSK